MTGSGDTRRPGGAAGQVSVIVPCYNKAEFVAETLESLLVQADVPLEVIVVDDASTDGSWEVISGYLHHDRVEGHRLPENRGSTFTRNHGAQLASGEFLMFLDADDLLAPGTLTALTDALRDSTDAVAASPWKKLQRENGGWVPRPSGKPLDPPGGDPVRAWLEGWYYPPCAILWRRTIYDRSGGWGEMGPWDDADIMMRALVDGTRLALAKGGMAYYRILDEGDSLRSLPTESATRSRVRVLDNVRRHARERGSLDRYRASLGAAYYRLGRTYAAPYPDLVLECFEKAESLLGRRPLSGSPLHRTAWRVLGLVRKERITRWMERRGLLRRRGHGGFTEAG